ncbi:MAG TPA: uroporphyrinogen decarboxylase family protein [Candidatus Acidoferrales bacterium]
MAEKTGARQIVKGLLQGIAPPRPLFLPIVFSHGARIENVPLRVFLTNPTKISNSQRQIRGRLHSDGVTCYFDPLLEAEALGGRIEWDAEGQIRWLEWPGDWGESTQQEVVGDSAKRGRVGVALEVVRRLKLILRDDCLLMAGIAGPFALATMLARLNREQEIRLSDIPATTLDLAAALIAPLATSFVEAGAGVIFIREEILPALSEEACAEWAARVAAAVNIVRFYEALPILLLTNRRSVEMNRETIVRQNWDCVVCPAWDGTPEGGEGFRSLGAARFGIALPADAFKGSATSELYTEDSLRGALRESTPAVVTTAGEVPADANMERLNKVWENICG